MDSTAGANQTGTMSWVVTTRNSQSPGWPRIASGTHPDAVSASPAYTALSRQTSGQRRGRRRRYQTARAPQPDRHGGRPEQPRGWPRRRNAR